MSQSDINQSYQADPAGGNANELAGNRSIYPLRWWPAVILMVVMAVVPYVPALFEAPPLPVFMFAMMGPAALGIILMIWWLFFSRATNVEKAVGCVGMIAVAAVGLSMLHKSMAGMGAIISVVPTTIAAFGLPIVLLSRFPQYRVPAALVTAALVMGYWNMIQSKGVTGRFVAETEWRWKKTSEEQYLEKLSKSPGRTPAKTEDNSPPVTLVNSEWPSFRGPSRDGRQDGVAFPEDWNSTPPKLLWRIPIGPAWSSFTVSGDRLFTQEQRGDNEAVLCLNANTGETIWAYEYKSRFWESVAGAGPRATPTIADEGLFALGADGILVCLDARTGKEKWVVELQKDAKRKPPQWGFSASPLVVDGLVIVHAGGENENGLLAYSASTGELIWSVPSGDHSYSSAQVATFDQVTGVLMETNKGLQFINPKDGDMIWEHSWEIPNYRALQPAVIGNKVLIASSLGEGTRCLEVSHEGDTWKVDKKWSSKDLKPDFNDFVEHKGYLYGYDGAIFACVDLKDGKRKWKKGRYGSGQVVLLPQADQLLVVSEQGELVLLKADPEKQIELTKISAIEGKTWNHPVVIGNRIYVRNAEQAACYEFPASSNK